MCSPWVCSAHFSPTEETAHSWSSKLPSRSEAGTICLGLVGSLCSDSESPHTEDRSVLSSGEKQSLYLATKKQAKGSLAPGSLA